MSIIHRKTVRFLTIATTVMAVAAFMSSCHTSKKGTGSQQQYVVPEKRAVDEMKKDLSTREYDLDEIGRLISEAGKWIGVPYRYAGHTTAGTDCSGFVMEVFRAALDLRLPRSSREQQQWCKEIKRDNLLPGDLLFFATGKDSRRVSHVGLYIGNGAMIHASSSRGVTVSNINERYYDTRFHSAGRVEYIGKLYADNDKKRKNDNRSTPDDTPPAPLPATPSVQTSPTTAIAAGDSVGQPKPAIELDNLITEKVDSIYTGFFD